MKCIRHGENSTNETGLRLLHGQAVSMDKSFCRFRANSNPTGTRCNVIKIWKRCTLSFWLISRSSRAKRSCKASAILKTTDYKRLQISNNFPSSITTPYALIMIKFTSGGVTCAERTLPPLGLTDVWKRANMVLIPKEMVISSCPQLRPISLTDLIMRILERCVYKNEIVDITRDFIGCDQYAY